MDAPRSRSYLPEETTALVPVGGDRRWRTMESINERELIFKFLFDMKSDLNALKEQVRALAAGSRCAAPCHRSYREELMMPAPAAPPGTMSIRCPSDVDEDVDHTEVEETLSIEDKEKEMIRKALGQAPEPTQERRPGIGDQRTHAVPQDQGIRHPMRSWCRWPSCSAGRGLPGELLVHRRRRGRCDER